MYSHLANLWIADDYVAHYISLFPNDVNARKAWFWMGFGMISVDGLRGLDLIRSLQRNVQIRRADVDDLAQVIEMHKALRQYMKGSPVFLLTGKKDRSYFESWLQSSTKEVWIAYRDDEPVAFMRLGPADEDVCTIIYDEKTTSIYAAFTKEKGRVEGIARALLERVLKSARESGLDRCAVSFEPMNLLATRFWLKYFKPVCVSVLRYVDDRLVQN
jgi:GNAT superfamily N-acetyltransferase